MKQKILFLTGFLSVFLFVFSCSSDDNDPQESTSSVIVGSTSITFDDIEMGTTSLPKTTTLKGNSLSKNVSITVSEEFFISANNTDYAADLVISPEELNNKTFILYVRFTPEDYEIKTGSIIISSSEFESIEVQLSGNGVAQDSTPSIIVGSTSITFDDIEIETSSLPQTTTLKGNSLSENVTLAVSEGFSISANNTDYGADLVISPEELNNEIFTLYVRFTPEDYEIKTGSITISSSELENIEVELSGNGVAQVVNYVTFNNQRLAFGGGHEQSSVQTFMLYDDPTKVEKIEMYIKLRCPAQGCNIWDMYANIQVKDDVSGEWYEIARYITPYGVNNSQAGRGFKVDVTDFKSLLTGTAEMRAFIEVWGADGWLVSVDFDYTIGASEYPYSAVSRLVQYNQHSLAGVIYGEDASAFDLTKSVQIPANAQSTHLRTIISGWGHATPNDSGGRGCAEWCFRTHNVAINGGNMFSHYMGPIGCASNPVQPQYGNWQPDRAGWCPGMAVPVRTDVLTGLVGGDNFDFEYLFQPWINNMQSPTDNPHAYYAISTFVIVKSDTPIAKPVVTE